MVDRFDGSPEMQSYKNGDYVRYSDYAALEAENERLTRERPMKKFYVLQGEYGEYEQRAENTYGVFDTRDQALAAMHEVPRLSAEGYARYTGFERRCEELAALEGAPKVETYILDQTEEERAAWWKHMDKVREIKSRIGPAPDFFCESERYWITEFVVGEIGCGNVVFATDRDADESADLTVAHAVGEEGGLYGEYTPISVGCSTSTRPSEQAVTEAARRVLKWVEPITGDNRNEADAKEEIDSVAALKAAMEAGRHD